jgi:hypothetical protein
MPLGVPSKLPSCAARFPAEDVAAILRERKWLSAAGNADAEPALQAWFSRAALENLLALIFGYDARKIVQDVANQAVLAREGSREVIRELANRVLDGGDVDSNRLKEIIDAMKAAVPYRSREMFHPIRVALAGRAGDGDLDRVILLLDGAAKLPFAAPVKGTRQRMLEFCAAFD